MIIEQYIRAWLDARLDVPVFCDTPEKPPAGYVLIEKTNADKTNFVVTSELAIKSHGTRLNDAIELNEQVKELMVEFENDDNIAGVKFTTAYNFTDTQTKRYRYQAVFQVAHF